jgi:hypothetical protein
MGTRKGITRGDTFFNIGVLILPLLAGATQTSSIIGRRRRRLTTNINNSKAPTSIRQAFDSLWITIARSRAHVRQFQIKLERSGARPRYGWLERHDIARTEALQELRRSYERQLQIMHELAVAGASVPPPDESQLLVLGRQIAEILPQSVRQEIVAAVQRARQRRRALRLVLELADDARELLGIPWELMALPVGWGARAEAGEDSFLLLNADITLIRQVRGVGINTALILDHPLRLQAFAATPLYVRPIDIHTTLEAIKQVQPSNGTSQHWYNGSNTLGALQERLSESRPQVVHLLCHGEQRDVGREVPRYDLLFTHADGYTHRVSAADLAGVLTLAPDLQLVVLQACYAGTTAVSSADEGERSRQVAESIALALVRSGVPAVIAMQGEVAQQAATAFVRTCYASLTRGERLDQAVAAGRIAMRAAGGVVDWSLPVIYRGSRPIPAPWYTRLVERFEMLLPFPSFPIFPFGLAREMKEIWELASHLR